MDAKQVSLVRICMSNFSSPQFHAESMSLPHVTFSWIVGSWNVVSQVRTSFVLLTYEVQGTFTILEYLPCGAEIDFIQGGDKNGRRAHDCTCICNDGTRAKLLLIPHLSPLPTETSYHVLKPIIIPKIW